MKPIFPRRAVPAALALFSVCSARAADPDRWQTPKPDKPDLSVAYIERTPRYPGMEVKYRAIDFSPNGPKGDGLPVQWTNAKAQHWPKVGQTVTFTAHVQNKGGQPSPRYDWHWLIDGKEVQEGWSDPLPVQGERTYTRTWKWQTGRHYVSFEVDRGRNIDQITHKNDFVADPTDALTFHFFVEADVDKWFDAHMNGLDSYSWPDWAQFQVREMNREFRDDVYPSVPQGIEIRARLDKVTVLPNGFKDPGGTHAPIGNVTSGWDGVWGFTNGLLDKDKDGKNFYEAQPQWLLGPEWPLHHELGHQFGQPDYYLLPVTAQNNRALPGVKYTPPAWFTSQMMDHGNYYHDEQIGHGKGVWDSGYRFWGEAAARAFNRDAHDSPDAPGMPLRRGFFGTFLVDVPTRNTFRFMDEGMKPLAGATVAVYPAVSRDYGNAWFPAAPKFTGKTDANGYWTLPKSPYSVVLNWTSNGAVQFIVTPPAGGTRVGFLNISDFNLEYWRGNTADAKYTVKTEAVK